MTSTLRNDIQAYAVRQASRDVKTFEIVYRGAREEFCVVAAFLAVNVSWRSVHVTSPSTKKAMGPLKGQAIVANAGAIHRTLSKAD